VEVRLRKGFMPARTYRLVLLNVPIPTVDFVVTRRAGGRRRQFMLATRTERPYKGRPFLPGGRILRAETVEQAAARQIYRELGCARVHLEPVGWLSVRNPPKFGRDPWYSIWHVFHVPLAKDAEIRLNSEHAGVRWYSRIDPRWPAPVRKALRMAGFR
jgi:ADP-ribose pyrophosphatase YjhB (NUDIX family)